jgi:hypothetical protein
MEKEGTMDDPRLERLWAINEIQQLAYRYAFAFDSRDVDELASLWAETERSASPPEIDIHTVRDEFDQWLYGLGPTVLAVCNHIIEIDNPTTLTAASTASPRSTSASASSTSRSCTRTAT